MSRITDIYLIDTLEQNALIKRVKTPTEKIPEMLSQGFAELSTYIQNNDVALADTPFLRIVDGDSDSVEIIIGMAVAQKVKPQGELEAFIIPAGKKIFAYWLGDNSQMMPLYEEMITFTQKSGYKAQDNFFEYYLNGTEYGKENLLTKVVMVLE